ncbi:hypothetical protein [Clostridium sp. HMSC19A10]|uniref:hypothetical protein n=1 Tax=Clostridium TaxID=1485 RepID=UPI0008A5EB2A|nr:hypothetical protein [Clostridium sp. HMSC19A10]OFS24192.1 hypothetical protein HMPREF3070_05895 [Clostridium sp. HMSC19A10]
MLKLSKYSAWLKNKDIIRYSSNVLNNYKFSQDTVNILSNIGVPYKIEPFIWFLTPEEGGLEKLGDYYYSISNEEKQEVIKEKQEYLNNLVILAKSSGDAICFNKNNQLVWIDYDDFEESFVNSSLEEFIKCIICFNDLVDDVYQKYNKKIHYYDFITKDDVLKLRKKLDNICKSNLYKSDFWNIKLEFLEDNI